MIILEEQIPPVNTDFSQHLIALIEIKGKKGE
jgi:hypothetical protein